MTTATMTERQRILLETTIARDKAEALLKGLVDAKTRSEKYLAETNQLDAMKQVTGRSSMDNAIVSTRRMIDTLNRTLSQLKDQLSDEDFEVLGR